MHGSPTTDDFFLISFPFLFVPFIFFYFLFFSSPFFSFLSVLFPSMTVLFVQHCSASGAALRAWRLCSAASKMILRNRRNVGLLSFSPSRNRMPSDDVATRVVYLMSLARIISDLPSAESAPSAESTRCAESSKIVTKIRCGNTTQKCTKKLTPTPRYM